MRTHVLIFSGHILLILLGGVLVLLLANITVIYLKFVLQSDVHYFNIYYFDSEFNIPAIFSFLNLLLCSVLLWSLSRLQSEKSKKLTWFWKTLSFTFLFLAVDELLRFHERINRLDPTTVAWYMPDVDFNIPPWTIPYLLLFTAVCFLTLKPLLRLPVRTIVLFAISGVLFVFGAVGMEVINTIPITELGYAVLVTMEELLEMVGIIIFIYTLLEYYLHRPDNDAIELNIRLQHLRLSQKLAGKHQSVDELKG